MEIGQRTQNIPTFHLLTFNIMNGLPNNSFGRNIVLILAVTSKKLRGKVKTIFETPCVAQQFPIYLMNVHLFFSKKGEMGRIKNINTYSSGS